ncbi:MAG: PQQ-binding-like beta-propeller repeat protein [Muribaculaceae bacterium]|nr:PQQ-binding-like beta-propeller repeat protein [Muribaculaceae bacterium]
MIINSIRHLLGAAVIFTVSSGLSAQRIAVLSDVHVSPGNACDSALRAAVNEINASDYDLVVMNGDLTNEGSDRELKNVKEIFDNVKHRFAVIPGNHENNWSQSATRTFLDLWGNDRFIEDLGTTVAVGINCGPFMKMGDGHIKQEDLHWLWSTLENCASQGKRILSFNHYPLQDDLDNWTEYVGLLEHYPVIGHINGHYHVWKQYRGGDIDAAMVRALDIKEGEFGYAIIDIDNDSVRVYEKLLNKEPALKFSWAARTEHTPSKFETTITEDVSPDGYPIEKIWTDSASVFTRLSFDNDNVYFGNSLGQFKAVDKNDGTIKWSIETGYPIFARATVLNSGYIALPCSEGIIVLNPEDGSQKTFYPTKQGPYVADGAVDKDIYIQGAYMRIEGRDPADGSLKWSFDSIANYCQAAPVIDGYEVIFGAWDTKLRCLDAKTGKLIWEWSNGRPNNLFSPGNVVPVVTPERVLIVAPDRYMTAIDRKTGKTIWRDNSHRYRESLGQSTDGSRAYAKTMDGHLVAVDTRSDSFNQLWDVDLGIGYDHAPCIIAEVDGIIYSGSRRGIVCAVDAENHNLLWSMKIGNGEINGIDIDPTTGLPWVSLIDGTIFKITKKPI